MAYKEMKKYEIMTSKRQRAMVMDLNKCLGCHTCTIACKTLWTSEEGRDYMYWNSVNTYPGRGYPRDWETSGGGYRNRLPYAGKLPTMKDYGEAWNFNYEEVYFGGKGLTERLKPITSDGSEPDWGPNWDEDQGAGEYPNAYYFYIPRICNHCTHPSCLDACPRNAIYKREEDGIVLLDEKRCQGYRYCIEACPYKKIYFNFVTKVSNKCIFCYPRLEKGTANACARQCPGRLRFVGYLDDEAGPIWKLVKKWKVALPLHPEFETEPNVYYVPPLSPPKYAADGSLTDESRIPIEYLRSLFGPELDAALKIVKDEMEKKRKGENSELMDLLIARRFNDMFKLT